VTQEQILAKLHNKRVSNLYQKYIDNLNNAYDALSVKGTLDKLKSLFVGHAQPTLLNKQNAEIGLLLLNAMMGHVDQTNGHISHHTPVVYKGIRYNRLEKILNSDNWEKPEHYNLLIFFFGEEKAAYIKYAWQQVPFQMYQKGFGRRSFRSPKNKEMYFGEQLNFLIASIPQAFTTSYDNSLKVSFEYYDLTIAEQLTYAHVLRNSNESSFRLWSAAIDMGNELVLKTAEDIIFNKAEDGKLTRGIIKALLNSNVQAAWRLVEQLLLAAQRQEGLRQSILEALDETSVGGVKYMVKVVLDNNLTRFSSVVRAVDVWAGLGWETERETTVRNFLQTAHLYLENPEKIQLGVTSSNNADVYMALWAQGVYDVEATLPYLTQLLQHSDAEKRALAHYFASQTAHYCITQPVLIKGLEDNNIVVLATVISLLHQTLSQGDAQYYNTYYPELFEKLDALYQKSTIKEKKFSGIIFSWLSFNFRKIEILQCMNHLVDEKQDRVEKMVSYFDDMNASLKATLSRLVLPKHSGYNYDINDSKSNPLNNFQRDFAFRIIKDRSEFDTAFKALYNVKFTTDEIKAFPDLLKRKAPEFRSKIIQLLVKQPDHLLSTLLRTIVIEGDAEQRLAGLDILIQLHKQKRLANQTAQLVAEFKERKMISPKEEILIAQFNDSNHDISAKNGYGLYNTQNMSAIALPAIDPSCEYEIQLAANKFALSLPYTTIKDAISDLLNLLDIHKSYEYDIIDWDNSVTTVLLGNVVRRKNRYKEITTNQEIFEDYPLYDIWQDWHLKWNLHPRDLFVLALANPGDRKDTFAHKIAQQLPNVTDFLPKTYLKKYGFYEPPIFTIINALCLVHPFENTNVFALHACVRLFSSLDRKILSYVEKFEYSNKVLGWQNDGNLNLFLTRLDLFTIPEQYLPAVWNVYNWRQFAGIPECVEENIPPLILFCRAYEANIISKDELQRGILTPENIRLLSEKKIHKRQFDYIKHFPFLPPIFDKIKDYLLDIELKRGDTSTTVTPLVFNLQAISGTNRFAQILAGLGKTTLHRGYIYAYGSGDLNKQQIFSTLLKRCFAHENDTQAFFNEKMLEAKIEDKRLIEAAMYAPQWQKMVSSFLGWNGLETAIWWMHAHTKTDAYEARSTEAESEIARYSALDLGDFKVGAVDKDWFLNAYKAIGKDKWPLVYDAAKYISDGNGHRRARIYADVILGNIQLKEVTERIRDKRDQDYLRVYGLVPLSKQNPASDVLERYVYLQQFKKESGQFGAQKQASEALGLRVAMENLARNAGYADPIRLTWAMEIKQTQTILSKETQIQFDDVVIGLVIGEDGMADVVAFKDENPLKAIPAKYKKDKKVEELNIFRKTLREQYKRSRKGLEDAMVRGDLFQLSEIQELFSHPVISRHLEKLIFIAEGNEAHGFYANKLLISDTKKEYTPSPKDKFRIAHCTDLNRIGAWAGYQKYSFEHQLQQPFKQIFRELYLPTEDELGENAISRRYAGHQVQPKQTLALLKTKGWKADYEEGLQKVFHKEGFAAKMYALADWFSPAEMESPTLETIEFHDLKTSKNVAFSSIAPRIFSEVMRDIDLVVSVAHVGGVDAEASHSSIQMRGALLTETMRLFKIKNVTVSGTHAFIEGKLGAYNVHLGSAVVHQVAAGYLSILPVHAQHRGRLFLPFVDDDPKAAELISKVLLLARDHDIQDPTILRQLR